jgi:hypothetical protein
MLKQIYSLNKEGYIHTWELKKEKAFDMKWVKNKLKD